MYWSKEYINQRLLVTVVFMKQYQGHVNMLAFNCYFNKHFFVSSLFFGLLHSRSVTSTKLARTNDRDKAINTSSYLSESIQ